MRKGTYNIGDIVNSVLGGLVGITGKYCSIIIIALAIEVTFGRRTLWARNKKNQFSRRRANVSNFAPQKRIGEPLRDSRVQDLTRFKAVAHRTSAARRARQYHVLAIFLSYAEALRMSRRGYAVCNGLKSR